MVDEKAEIVGSNVLLHSQCLLSIKRLIDIIISSVVLFCMSPFLLLIGLLVKFFSSGPVFYSGIRSGFGGKTFKIYKFRSMVENAEALGGPTTGSNDQRVTKIGALLRKTKLDELPQFINVLLGDMSIVGPRPEVLEYTSQFYRLFQDTANSIAIEQYLLPQSCWLQ